MRVDFLLGLYLFSVLGLFGCQFKGDPSQGMGTNARGAQPAQGGGQAAQGQPWRARPTAMRIYPSTRFVTDEEGALLQARIELFDQMGDSIKSAGSVQFELHAAAQGADRVGQLLYQWQINLRTMESQRRFYDPIFRGYEFHLRIDDQKVARRPTILRATFTPTNGQRMTSESRVRGDW